MTSISHMQCLCPVCNYDLREMVHTLTIGDSEDVMDVECPGCSTEMEVELLAMFEVRPRNQIGGR